MISLSLANHETNCCDQAQNRFDAINGGCTTVKKMKEYKKKKEKKTKGTFFKKIIIFDSID